MKQLGDASRNAEEELGSERIGMRISLMMDMIRETMPVIGGTSPIEAVGGGGGDRTRTNRAASIVDRVEMI